MKRIEIQLSRLKALQMVSAETVYVGGRSVGADDPSTYDKVFATDDDTPFLATMYDTAVTSLVTICGEWVDSVTDTDDGSIITLALPDNLAPQGERNIMANAMAYVIASILADYLGRLAPESAKFYAEQGTTLAEAIVSDLNARKRVKYTEKTGRK